MNRVVCIPFLGLNTTCVSYQSGVWTIFRPNNYLPAPQGVWEPFEWILNAILGWGNSYHHGILAEFYQNLAIFRQNSAIFRQNWFISCENEQNPWLILPSPHGWSSSQPGLKIGEGGAAFWFPKRISSIFTPIQDMPFLNTPQPSSTLYHAPIPYKWLFFYYQKKNFVRGEV